MSDIAIRVENLSKQYRIGGTQERFPTLRDKLGDSLAGPLRRLRQLGRPAPPEETIWALKDVSFEACPELGRRVKRGEVVGIPSTSSGHCIGKLVNMIIHPKPWLMPRRRQ